MNWWAVVTLVGGYVVGFISDIGKDYFKEILADRRRERKAAERFSRVRQAMPDMIRELKAHFEQHENAREFIVLRDPTEIYQDGPNSTRFCCYRNRHPHLAENLAQLEEEGYVRDVSPPPRNVSIYRMTEDFIEFVRKS